MCIRDSILRYFTFTSHVSSFRSYPLPHLLPTVPCEYFTISLSFCFIFLYKPNSINSYDIPRQLAILKCILLCGGACFTRLPSWLPPPENSRILSILPFNPFVSVSFKLHEQCEFWVLTWRYGVCVYFCLPKILSDTSPPIHLNKQHTHTAAKVTMTQCAISDYAYPYVSFSYAAIAICFIKPTSCHLLLAGPHALFSCMYIKQSSTCLLYTSRCV